jgi:pSer/pThr/pTyr-binding forkhead associated (FHA) protein
MASLVIKSPGFENRILELKIGLNRLGRGPGNDFQIEHPTISARHCEVELIGNELIMRDCGSTNGTLVAGHPVKEAKLIQGQTFCLGDVVVLVENTEVTVAIPRFDVPDERPKPPVVTSDGTMVCPRHPQKRATYQCTHCLEVMCDECAHRLRRQGGKVHHLCPRCSHPCAPLERPRKSKKSFFNLVTRTVRIPFTRGSKTNQQE